VFSVWKQASVLKVLPVMEKGFKLRTMDASTRPGHRLRRNLALLFIAAFLSALAVFLLWQRYPEPAHWVSLLEDARLYLKANPWALLLTLATLPGVGFPISPLLILFGIVFAPRFGMPATLAMAIAAQAVCTVWTYGLAAGPLRGFLSSYVIRRRELPQLTDKNTLRLGLMLRLTPGFPYALQNIVLGILGMRWRPYLLVSIPITSLWAVGFVMTGGAIFEGELAWILTGAIILITLVLATRMWRRKNTADV
jgi:uncharacterized membrane protein YdjX (TVP38/TMEM64 family)